MREGFATANDLFEGFAFKVLHDEVKAEAIEPTKVCFADDVFVVQRSDHAGFSTKALDDFLVSSELWMQELDSVGFSEVNVFSEIDDPIPPEPIRLTRRRFPTWRPTSGSDERF